MLVRYFAAARAAAGLDEQEVPLTAPITAAELVELLRALHPVSASEHTPALAELLGRCSFLRNEIALRDHSTALQPADVIDVLPPFAGG